MKIYGVELDKYDITIIIIAAVLAVTLGGAMWAAWTL